MTKWMTNVSEVDPQGNGHSPYLPSKLYTDGDIFEAERKKVFVSSWQLIGSVDQLESSGDYVTDTVAGREILVIRDDDTIRGFYNVCPHRGSKILDGCGNQGMLQCPYHAWTFQKDGSLKSAPNFDPEDIDYSEHGLHPINVEIRSPFIFVNLEPDPIPLDDVVGPTISALNADYDLGLFERVKRIEYEMGANWKVVVDNFLECDHCSPCHHDFAHVQDLKNYTGEYHDYCSTFEAPIKEVDTDIYSKSMDEWKVKEGRYNFVWPNMTINVYPSPVYNLNTMRWVPVDVDTTLAIFDFYFMDDELTTDVEETIDFIHTVQEEDIEICERQHVGLRSEILEEGILADTEKGIHHFHTMVRDALGEAV